MTLPALALHLSGMAEEPVTPSMLALSHGIDDDAELALLQLLLLSPEARDVASHTLREHHWYSHPHRLLFRAAITAGEFDGATEIGKAMVLSHDWESIGGSIYMARVLCHDPVIAGDAPSYCQRIRTAYRYRETLGALRDAVTRLEMGEGVDETLTVLGKRTKGARL